MLLFLAQLFSFSFFRIVYWRCELLVSSRLNTHTHPRFREEGGHRHATPRLVTTGHGCGCCSGRFVKIKVKVNLEVNLLDLLFLLLPWMVDSARKGSEPRFTLSSSNQLIVQTRRAVFGEQLFLCLLSHVSCLMSLISLSLYPLSLILSLIESHSTSKAYFSY